MKLFQVDGIAKAMGIRRGSGWTKWKTIIKEVAWYRKNMEKQELKLKLMG